jgi:hypothetical protein
MFKAMLVHLKKEGKGTVTHKHPKKKISGHIANHQFFALPHTIFSKLQQHQAYRLNRCLQWFSTGRSLHFTGHQFYY